MERIYSGEHQDIYLKLFFSGVSSVVTDTFSMDLDDDGYSQLLDTFKVMMAVSLDNEANDVVGLRMEILLGSRNRLGIRNPKLHLGRVNLNAFNAMDTFSLFDFGISCMDRLAETLEQLDATGILGP